MLLSLLKHAWRGWSRTGAHRLQALEQALDAGDIGQADTIAHALDAGEREDATACVLLGRLALALGERNVAANWFERALAQPSPPPQAHYWRAVMLMESGKANEALSHALTFERAAPGNASMRSLIGVVRHQQGDVAAACAAFESALQAEPDHIEAHRNLAVIWFQNHLWEKALVHSQRLAELKPGEASALSGYASCLAFCGRVEEAWPVFERALTLPGAGAGVRQDMATALFQEGRVGDTRARLDEALRLKPDVPLLHAMRASCELITQGDSAAAWEEYEWRRKMHDTHFRVHTRTWNGDTRAPGRLLIYPEQGMGDVLLFARYLERLRDIAAHRVVQAPAPLMRLLRASGQRFAWGIAEWVESQARITPQQTSYDLEIPLLSLKHVLGAGVERSARGYLHPGEDLVREWAAWLGPRVSESTLRVGLVWAGNPTRMDDQVRSIPTAQLASLGAACAVEFVNLQMDAKPQYRGTPAPLTMRDPTPRIRDFADTAAIMCNLDLVLSIDTAAAHLAGALGVPCWVLLSRMRDWRWEMGDSEQPWYASHRTFRVARQRGWTPLLEEVVARLRAATRDTLSVCRNL
jgi:tetratricopeptide (TPR) repeat protein